MQYSSTAPQHALGDQTARILADGMDRIPAGHTGPVSLALPLDGAFSAGILKLEEGDFFLSSPVTGRIQLGRGIALEMHAKGPGRLHELSRQAARLRANWHFQDPFATGLKPQLCSAFAFDHADPMNGSWSGFPNAALVLPELMLQQTRGRAHVILSTDAGKWKAEQLIARWMSLLEGLEPASAASASPRLATACTPGQDKEAEEWMELVRSTLGAIARGQLDKAVIYRTRRLLLDHPMTAEALAGGLHKAFPQCRIIAIRRTGAALVSASPERLLSKQGNRIGCDVLAGTAPRAPDPEIDQQLARRLQDDPKTRLEHALVEQAIRGALAPLCRQLQAGAGPRIRRLRNVQHLYLRLHGTLEPDLDLLQIASHLHPTPAVNGSPVRDALDWLRLHRQADRGWYSGAAGWMDWDGDGSLDVLLRCALLRGREAQLYAGAGLVAGSDPHAELRETELKLDAVRQFLG